MRAPDRTVSVALCRTRIVEADSRLEALRIAVERRPARTRTADERALDRLRGMRNRAMARVEAAHRAPDDGCDGPLHAALAAVDALLTAMRDVEHMLDAAAA